MPPFIFLLTPDGGVYAKIAAHKPSTSTKYNRAIETWKRLRKHPHGITLNLRAYRAARYDHLLNAVARTVDEARQPWRQGVIKED